MVGIEAMKRKYDSLKSKGHGEWTEILSCLILLTHPSAVLFHQNTRVPSVGLENGKQNFSGLEKIERMILWGKSGSKRNCQEHIQ